MRAAQALQQKHEEIESQHSVMQHTHTHKVHEVNNYKSKHHRFKPCDAATLILQVPWKMHTIWFFATDSLSCFQKYSPVSVSAFKSG